MIGRSKPSSRRSVSTCSREAPSGTSSRVGSPENRMMTKTIVITPKTAIPACSSRQAA
jgi:hypothetical protein